MTTHTTLTNTVIITIFPTVTITMWKDSNGDKHSTGNKWRAENAADAAELWKR